MIHNAIRAAINEVLADLPESKNFKNRLNKLLENALTQRSNYDNDDLYDILELAMSEEAGNSAEGREHDAG